MSYHILIVSYDFRPNLGGVASCAFSVANSLAKKEGIKVTVLAPYKEGVEEFDKQSSLDIIRVKLPATAILSTIPLAIKIHEIVGKKKIDHIINMLWMPSGISSFMATRLNGCPYSTFAHGVEIIESQATLRKRIRSLLAPVKALVFKNSVKALCVSDFTAQKVESLCDLTSDQALRVYNGVDCQEFYFEEAHELKEGLKISDDEKVFFSLSRIEDYKGMDMAIKAFARLKDDYQFKYLIGGIGPYLEQLKSLVKDLGLDNRVVFLGKIPGSELRKYFSLADWNILLTRYDDKTPNFEGFGLVFLEAAACRTPSLAGRSGGIPSAVKDGETGLLVDPENIDEIEKLFKKVLSNEIDQNEYSLAAYKRATHEMTWNQMTDRILEGIR